MATLSEELEETFSSDELGVLVKITIAGQSVGAEGDKYTHPDMKNNIWMIITDTNIGGDAGAAKATRTIKTSMSGANIYKPDRGHTMTINGVEYTITEIDAHTLGTEVYQYDITGTR